MIKSLAKTRLFIIKNEPIHSLYSHFNLKPKIPSRSFGCTKQLKLIKGKTPYQLQAEIKQLEQKMLQHARDLEFEQAAKLRDQVHALKQALLEI